jgi:hypothetical protein
MPGDLRFYLGPSVFFVFMRMLQQQTRKGLKMNIIKITKNPAPEESGIQNFCERFLNDQDVKQSSMDTYRKALKAFIVWLSDQGIHNPVREDIWPKVSTGAGLSPFTYLDIVVVRSFSNIWLTIATPTSQVSRGQKGQKDSGRTP